MIVGNYLECADCGRVYLPGSESHSCVDYLRRRCESLEKQNELIQTRCQALVDAINDVGDWSGTRVGDASECVEQMLWNLHLYI